MMKKIFALLALVGLAAAPSTTWAIARYDGELKVTASAGGTVAASKSQTPGTYGATASVSDTHNDTKLIGSPDTYTFTFYAFAQAAEGADFDGWYSSPDYSGSPLSTAQTYACPVEVKKNTSIGTAKTETVNLYAKFTARSVDISTLGITLRSSSFLFTGTEQGVEIVAKLQEGVDYTVGGTRCAVGSALEDQNYSVTLTAVAGSGYTGSVQLPWKIVAPTGSFEENALSAGAGCTASGNAVTVTDSKSLEYDNNGTWYASMTVTWPHTQSKDDSYVKSAVYTDKAHAQIRLSTTGDTVYSGDAILNGSAVGLSGSVKDVRFSYYWTYTYRNYHYLSTTTWRVPLTVAQIKAAKDAGYLSYALTAVGLAWADRPLDDNGSNPLTEGTWGNAAGIRETTYTLTVPIDENLVLNDENGVQVYPEHQHDWSIEKSADGSGLTATCRASGCPQGTLALALGATSKDFDRSAVVATVEGAEAFRTHVGATIGAVTYNGGETAPKYTGDYTAAVEVTVDGTAYTLTKAFSITKPASGYTSGYEVGATGVEESKWVSYDTWAEALAAAQDEETIYRHEGDWSAKTYDFTSDKDVTVDLCGAKLRHPSDGKNAIQNLGSGTVTLVNGRIEQAKNIYAQDFDVVGAADKDGGFILGKDLVILNKATTDDGRIDMTVSNIRLEIAGGQYQFAKISGAATITGGTFWKYFDPTAYVPNCGDDYVVREKDFDDKDGNGEKITYRYTVLPHEHILTYAANGNVITVTCTAENADICTYKPNNGEKLTLTAATVNVADLGGDAYAGAGYVCTDKFPVKDAVITYWQGDQQLPGAPTDTGDYVAKVTVGEATAEATFRIIHTHSYSYAVEGDSIVATCGAVGSCDAPRFTATLTADGATYTGSAYTGASTSVDEGYPVEVVLTYWQGGQQLEGEPTNAGDYIAKMSAGGQTVEKAFTIAKADLASVTFALKEGEFTFDHAAHTAALAAHALGGYVLQEGTDYTVGGDALTQVGSPAANTTYTIEIAAAGDNFTGSRTLSWTIKTPITGTAKFDKPSVLGGDYGTVEGYALKVTDTTKMVYGNNAWAIGVKVGVPYKTDVFTPTAFFYFDSPKLDKAFVATDADACAAAGIAEMETEDVAFSAQGYKYLKSFAWVESITLAEVEAALAKDETTIVRTLKAYAMPYYASASYQNAGGIKVTEFAMEIPLTDLVLPVPADQALDAGDVAIDGFKLLLGKGAMVTANAQVADFATKIVTDGTAGYAVTESGEGPWTYRNSAVSYQITYQFEGSDGKEPVHANPTTYTVESETIAFSAASLDGYEFKGWNPASIAAGTTGDQTITGAFEKTSTPYEDVVVDDMEDGKTVTPEVRQAAAGKVESLCGGDEANIDAVKAWVTGQGVKAADLAKSEYTRASFDLGVALLDKGESVAEVAFDDVAEDSTNGFSFKIAVQFEGEPTPEIVKAVAEKVAGYIKATDALADGFDSSIDANRVTVDPATGTVTILPADEAKASEFFKIVLPKDVVK